MRPEPAADMTAPAMARLAGLLAAQRTDARVTPDLIVCARRQRVHLLLAGTLSRQHHVETMEAALREEYRQAAAADAAEDAAVRELLEAASREGVRPILFKGAALAHRVYERSWERPRTDVDLFIAERDAAAMRRALEAAGYERAPGVDGGFVTRQVQYVRMGPRHPRHQVDVHTRLFNPAAFAGVLTWDEADRRTVMVPALGPHARTLCDADALLVACVHRVAHHHGVEDLLWLCDVDRLARRLDAAEWAAFASAAARARVRAVCRASLAAATDMFATPVPSDVARVLSSGDAEPSAQFLHRGAGELRVQWLNLRHLDGWRARASLVRQHLFPSPEYMRARYGVTSAYALPFCYAHRLSVGVPRWLGLQRS